MNNLLFKKYKYAYNPQSLSYEKIEVSLKKRILNGFIILSIFAVASGISARILINYIESPKEKRLIEENKLMVDKYHVMEKNIENIYKKLEVLNQADDSIYRALLGKKQIAASVRNAGIGGTYNYFFETNSGSTQLINKTTGKIKLLENQLKISEKSFEELLKAAVVNKEKRKRIPAIRPVSNKDLKYTGSGFGMRYHPILKIIRPHEGIDFIGEENSEILVTADGVVKEKHLSKSFGNVIIVDHGYGYETLYAHLNKFNVTVGQKVKRGQVIGFMGNTGLSRGTHVHYEVHYNGKEIDPVHYFYSDLTTEDYNEICRIANSYKESLD